MMFSEEAYQRLLQDIFRRFPSVQKNGFAIGSYKPGLERIEAFDAALGYPSRQIRTIHIAGTNGKGSVSNMLASACSSCGLKSGLFTSPHILDFRERIRVADARPIPGRKSKNTKEAPSSMVPKEFVLDFLTQWMPWITEHQLSFFEISTGMAFQWFAEQKVDLAVIEVGLGGRLDSTNIITPELSVITSIGLDHCDLLGHSLEAIAGEKAGIIKDGVPVVIGESLAETDAVFRQIAREHGSSIVFADQITPRLWHMHEDIERRMDLLANVQSRNLRTVMAALDILEAGFPALRQNEKLLDGIVHTARDMDFHGRWELLSDQPAVVADIGHNAHALQHNFEQLQELVQSGEYSSLIIVFGIMADKDLDAIFPLMPRDATYIFTAPATPRALPSAQLLQRYRDYRALEPLPSCPLRAYEAPGVRLAVQMAVQLSQNLSQQLSRSASAQQPAPPLIYIGGSTYVVSEALPLFCRF